MDNYRITSTQSLHMYINGISLLLIVFQFHEKSYKSLKSGYGHGECRGCGQLIRLSRVLRFGISVWPPGECVSFFCFLRVFSGFQQQLCSFFEYSFGVNFMDVYLRGTDIYTLFSKHAHTHTYTIHTYTDMLSKPPVQPSV